MIVFLGAKAADAGLRWGLCKQFRGRLDQQQRQQQQQQQRQQSCIFSSIEDQVNQDAHSGGSKIHWQSFKLVS